MTKVPIDAADQAQHGAGDQGVLDQDQQFAVVVEAEDLLPEVAGHTVVSPVVVRARRSDDHEPAVADPGDLHPAAVQVGQASPRS